MKYKIKSGDTLSKIAKAHGLDLDVLLSQNPAIKDPNNIFVGQEVNIFSAADQPEDGRNQIVPSLPGAAAIIARAKSAIGKGIRYKLGGGGMKPDAALPDAGSGICDCSGFVCWVLELPRLNNQAFYKRYGGWINTDSMEDDILSTSGIFNQLSQPTVGCIVVYGAGSKIGHVGIVSEVKDGQMTKVIHCSSGNDRTFADSIQETKPTVFNRSDVKFGWYVGVESV